MKHVGLSAFLFTPEELAVIIRALDESPEPEAADLARSLRAAP